MLNNCNAYHHHVGATRLPANEEVVLEGVSGQSMEIAADIEPNGSQMVEMNVLRSPDRQEFTKIAFYKDRGYRNCAYDPPRQ